MQELFSAIRAGDAAAVESILDENPQIVHSSGDDGLAALTVAIYHRKPEIAALLERRGAKINLFAAAMSGRLEELRAALAADQASVNSLSADGWTALHLAAFFGSRECVDALLAAGARVNERSTNALQNMPLHAAAAGRHAEIARVLIESGAWVNARQQGGWTALHAAAQNGDRAMAELLIAGGADVQARADNHQNPLDLALSGGHPQVVEVLEHYGAAR